MSTMKEIPDELIRRNWERWKNEKEAAAREKQYWADFRAKKDSQRKFTNRIGQGMEVAHA